MPVAAESYRCPVKFVFAAPLAVMAVQCHDATGARDENSSCKNCRSREEKNSQKRTQRGAKTQHVRLSITQGGQVASPRATFFRGSLVRNMRADER